MMRRKTPETNDIGRPEPFAFFGKPADTIVDNPILATLPGFQGHPESIFLQLLQCRLDELSELPVLPALVNIGHIIVFGLVEKL